MTNKLNNFTKKHWKKILIILLVLINFGTTTKLGIDFLKCISEYYFICNILFANEKKENENKAKIKLKGQ